MQFGSVGTPDSNVSENTFFRYWKALLSAVDTLIEFGSKLRKEGAGPVFVNVVAARALSV